MNIRNLSHFAVIMEITSCAISVQGRPTNRAKATSDILIIFLPLSAGAKANMPDVYLHY